MQTKPYFLSLLILILLCTGVRAQTIPIELNLATSNDMTITESPTGTYVINTIGGDPRIRATKLTTTFDPETVYVLSFEYLAPAGLDDLQIFYGPPINGTQRIDFGSLPEAPTYRTFKAFMKIESPNWNASFTDFRFDFGVTSGQDITVRQLELRAPTDREVIPFTLNPVASSGAATVTDNGDGSFDVVTTGGDPWVRSTVIGEVYNPDSVFVLSYDYTTTSGLNDYQIFYGNPPSPQRKIEYGAIAPTAATRTFTTVFKAEVNNWDQFYEQFRFDFGSAAGLNIRVSNFLLREPTNAERKLVTPPADTVVLELDVNFTSGFLTATEPSPLEYDLVTVGPDPWIRSKPVTIGYDTDETYIFEFDYKATGDYNELQIFYGPPINGNFALTTEPIPAAADWTTYTINPKLLVDNFQTGDWTNFRFDLGRGEDPAVSKTFNIRNLIIRKPTAEEVVIEQNSDKIRSGKANDAFLAYLAETFLDTVNTVNVDMQNVSLGGAAGAGSRFLVEVLPEEYGFDRNTFATVLPLTVTDGRWEATLPRYVDLIENGRSRQRDRIYSRWAVAEQTGADTYVLTSFMKWPTDVLDAAINNREENKARTLKGIDGLTPGSMSMFSDLEDLEITSMKINLLIQAIFSLDTTTMSHVFNGKKYGVNRNFVNGLDMRIKALTDADIKTTLVYLVPLNQISDTVRTLFTHPDASLGNYSMANVTSAQGVEYYTAMTDFLAERYSRPDSLYGRLDQWIVHNEVDAHTDWTHAGEKPVDLYTQIYDRSMRLVHYTIRKHDPTAKVFTTFTKHWNSIAGDSRNFRSVDVLDRLTDLMTKEGDYEWGIGWHSYPTNLADPRVWLDPIPRTRLDLLTPEITPRNLEMIDVYVRQKSVLYNGKKIRTVLLSENGFNSNPDSPNSSPGKQAAALAYFWKKAVNNRLPSIENIQLHRWVDFPTEGGILFGLWTTKPGTRGDFEEKKVGWFVWDAAGTPQEEAVFAPYLDTVGISDWSEIQFTVASETTPYPAEIAINCPGDPTTLVMSYNGEKKIPDANGMLQYFNVASDVAQPYVISRDGEVLASGRLDVTGPTDTTLSLCSLPVSWLSFSAGARGKFAALDWTTSFEDDNDGFTVERSADGANWSALGRVAASISPNDQAYAYTDRTPITGDNYYRIIQTDFDGQSTVSPVRRVQFSGTPGTFTVFPNPTTGLIRLELPAGFELRRLELIDPLGRVSELAFATGDRNVRLPITATGTYVLRAVALDGALLTGKVVLR
ncbi:DUF5722 domain-containing protein [Neolewinella antarctica]|uniref:DUF5722 domain-containing protein n=1 Tax=Neolewinella antarctica TaxID=442734 RepID=A0ABX0XB53_9BACT|nr:DUF5722 domain-containing protein [Neolewinella antarctica]NJC26442.1 hypothetical protein [Neolewinella antarctica]